MRIAATVKAQHIPGQPTHSGAVRLRPLPETAPQIIQVDRAELRCFGDDDRHGQIVIVRIPIRGSDLEHTALSETYNDRQDLP